MGKCRKSSKLITILVVAVCLIILIWVFRMDISRLTKGMLFGFQTTNITAEEMDGEIASVTDQDTKKLVKYAEKVQNYGENKLDGDEKDIYREYNALFSMLTDCASGGIILTEDNIQEEFDKHLKEFKREQSFAGNMLNSLVLTVNAEESTDIMIDSNLYLAYILKNSATSLMMYGQEDMALAMAAMATALAPENSSMSNLLANVMKEYGFDHTSYELLQYAIRINPNDEAALHSLGMLCIDMKKYDEAEKCFNRMLRLTGGKGTANQGWMLLALAEGDLPSAYLYMLEGAREGYTHTVTEVYEAFKLRSDYFDIAGPIFDQYPLYELVKFKRTQQVFDATLDTIDQQVVIDRQLKVCHDALGTIPAQAVNLLESKRYVEGMSTLILENFIGYMSTYSDEFAQIESLLKDEDLAKLFDGDFSGIGNLKDKYAMPEEEGVVYTYSYEQEIFFMNILQDYFKYSMEKNHEKYLDEVFEVLGAEGIGNPLGKFIENMEEYMEVKGAWMEDVSARAESPNLYTQLYAMLEMLTWVQNNMETNNNAMLESQFTIEQFGILNKAMAEASPLLEKGYMDCAILCEEYYLYTNNILGYIANDQIYNEWKFYQTLNVQMALLDYPFAGTAYNGIIALYALSAFGSAAGGGEFDIYIPVIPEFPVTGMGTPDGEPVVVWEYEPPQNAAIQASAEALWGDYIDSMEEQYEDGLTILEEEFGTTPNTLPYHFEPAMTIGIAPEQGQPAIAVEEQQFSGTKFGIKLGKFIEASYDPATGDITFGVGPILASAKATVNLRTTDITLYGHLGPDVDAKVGYGTENAPTNVNFGGGKIGGYAKLSLNALDAKITAAEVGADVGGSLAGYGLETEVGYDFASGVRVDTASLLLGNVKQTLKNE